MQIIIGTVLGDGYIGLTLQRKGILKLAHGARQRSYLLWKMRNLPSLFRRHHAIQSRASAPPWRNGTFAACSIVRDELTILRRQFYPRGRKIVPASLMKRIGPLALAVWYMDDGCLGERGQAVFAVNAFDDASVRRLAACLSRRFRIEARIYRVRPGQKHLYLPPTVASRFHRLVRPYVHAVMPYKLPVRSCLRIART